MCSHAWSVMLYGVLIQSVTFLEYATRRCGMDGHWLDKNGGSGGQRAGWPAGWTNYSACYSEDLRKLKKKIFSQIDPEVIVLFTCLFRPNITCKNDITDGEIYLCVTQSIYGAIMLNPIEKFKVAILHLNRDWSH